MKLKKIKRNLHKNLENLKFWNFCQPKDVLSKLCDFQKSALISSKQPPVQRMFSFCNVFKTLSHDDKKGIETKKFGSFLGTFDIFCLTEAVFVENFHLFVQKASEQRSLRISGSICGFFSSFDSSKTPPGQHLFLF